MFRKRPRKRTSILSICFVITFVNHFFFIHFLNKKQNEYLIQLFYSEFHPVLKNNNYTVIFNQDYLSKKNNQEFDKDLDQSSSVDFDIDFVYTWVNGNDSKWKKIFNEEKKKNGQASVTDNDERRYVDFDELRYSLRTVEKYAPFVRYIFIVTCGQIPDWINTSHPKIKFINHTQIFENLNNLPTFNSNAIESEINNIPGLAEHYVYFNDDVFLGAPVSPSDFFYIPPKNQDESLSYSKSFDLPTKSEKCIGMPIWIGSKLSQNIRNIKQKYDRSLKESKIRKYAVFSSMYYYTLLTYYKKYGNLPYFDREHIAISLTKTLVQSVIDEFQPEFFETRKHKFREVTDIVFSNLIFMYGLKNKLGFMKKRSSRSKPIFFYIIDKKSIANIETNFFVKNENGIASNCDSCIENSVINPTKDNVLKVFPQVFCINVDVIRFRTKIQALLEIITEKKLSTFEILPPKTLPQDDYQFWLSPENYNRVEYGNEYKRPSFFHQSHQNNAQPFFIAFVTLLILLIISLIIISLSMLCFECSSGYL